MAKIISKDSENFKSLFFLGGALMTIAGVAIEIADKLGQLNHNIISKFHLHETAFLYGKFGATSVQAPEWFKNVDSLSTVLIIGGLLLWSMQAKRILNEK